MNKRLSKALLFGTLLLASTSVFVSCKDYDDDINSLQAQIDQKADKTALEQAKTDLKGEIASLKSQLEAKDAELTTLINSNKADIQSEITRAKAAEAALEARIATAEAAIKRIDNVLAGKVDQSEYDAEVKKIYAQISAVDTKLAGALERIATLEKGLKDEETARLAVAADLEQQKLALQKLSERLDATEKELKEKIEAADKVLQNQINDLKTAVTTNTTDIDALKKSVQNIYNQITEINNEIAVMNVFVSGQLRSLVFVPQTYYHGVEATEAFTLNYVYYWPKDFTGANWADASADVKEPVGYSDCKRYKSNTGSTALDVIAHYHMNPSVADIPDDVKILDADKDFITTRTSASVMSVKLDADGKKMYKKNGSQLDVTLKFNDPSKIKSVPNDAMITVFATEAKYSSNGKDTTITSDYAAVYKTTIDKLVLSHIPTALSFTGQKNNCNHDFANVNDNLHSTNNCTLATKVDLHLMPTVYEAMAQPYQDICRYDQTLDLSKLVETHYSDANGVHKVMSANDLAGYGLAYNFELTASFEGGNSTSEAAHAGISGSTFRPQIPKADGKAYTYDEFTALNESMENVRAHAVGRQPIVRVTLIDTNNGNRVLDYGYIKIRITDKTITEQVLPNVVINYTGNKIEYKSECVPADFRFSTTWNVIEYDVLRMLGTTKAEFDANYDRNGQLVIDALGDVQQYSATSVKTTDASLATALVNPTTYIGTVVDNYDANNPETSTFTWTIPGAWLEQQLYGKTQHAPFQIAIRYKSLDQKKYPDVYIILSTGAITIERSNGVFLAEDGSDRIKEYWYKDNGNGAADLGDKEIHAQTLSPEDPQAVNIGYARDLDDRFSDVFVGNNIRLSSVTDITPNQDFAVAKRLYKFLFSSKNENKTFTGIDTLATGGYRTVTWTIGIKDDGRTLYAKAKNGVLCNQDIAYIQDGNGALATWATATAVKNQEVVYARMAPTNDMTEAAKSLLNYKAHNELADDVLKAIIALHVKTNVCEHELDLTNNEFNVRFLRPINAKGVNKELEDAKDTKQTVDLKSLVTLSDWREYGFASHANYWNYYQIEEIRVIGNYSQWGTETDNNGLINQYIWTTMAAINQPANKLEDKVRQSDISNQVMFRLIKPDATHPYGYLLYENLSSTVQTFTVRIPLLVKYRWGYVVTDADIQIKATHENARKF